MCSDFGRYINPFTDFGFKNLEKLGLNIIDRKAIYDKNGFSLTFAFVEMPKFNKKESELITYLDKWFYFLKNLDSLDDIPLIYKDEKVIIDAFKKAEYLNLPITFTLIVEGQFFLNFD